ncbi:hypothetical protein C8R47DRAFT_1111867 [Mycena vitilis]|nr:hypothetical protein C8R47DRAFT_1111867 [Mycena vitilis]
MALMSKQEMSHQQVMSYLLGGGDVYASHTFKVVKWGDFDRMIAKQEEEDETSSVGSAVPAEQDDPMVGFSQDVNMTDISALAQDR